MQAGTGLLDEWGGGDSSVHRVTLGAQMVWLPVRLEAAAGRCSFQGQHFGELWMGGSQELCVGGSQELLVAK